MKTLILDENQYPFEITPDAITTNFALFQKIIKDRELLTLVMFSDSESAERIVNSIEKKNWTEECIATGYFSYVGNKPNPHKWFSALIPFGSEMSRPVATALRSDIWKEVNKCFKGETRSLQQSASDTVPDMACVNNSEKTNLRYIPWDDKEDDALESVKDMEDTEKIEHDVVIRPIYSRDSLEKQPTQLM